MRMSTFIEYELEDGLTLLVEKPESNSDGMRQTSLKSKPTIAKANLSFIDALEGIKKSAILIRKAFHQLRADEVEVSFGLTTTGEVGNFAIGKIGIEVNYVVKLKWNNTSENK